MLNFLDFQRMTKVLLALSFLIISTFIQANPRGEVTGRISPAYLQGYTQCSCILVKSMVTSLKSPEYLGDHIYCFMREISSGIERAVTVPIPKAVFYWDASAVSYLISALCSALEQHVRDSKEL